MQHRPGTKASIFPDFGAKVSTMQHNQLVNDFMVVYALGYSSLTEIIRVPMYAIELKYAGLCKLKILARMPFAYLKGHVSFLAL